MFSKKGITQMYVKATLTIQIRNAQVLNGRNKYSVNKVMGFHHHLPSKKNVTSWQ